MLGYEARRGLEEPPGEVGRGCGAIYRPPKSVCLCYRAATPLPFYCHAPNTVRPGGAAEATDTTGKLTGERGWWGDNIEVIS